MLKAPWRLSGIELQEAQDDAVRLAIREQEDAGLAVVTDGELRRRHYIWGFLDGLTGVDTERLAQQRSRGGRYSETTEVARIVGAVERTRPVFLDACRFARDLTTRQLKVTLPGPMTIVDSVADEHYGADRKTLALRFAKALNAEARDLAAAGADIVQFDEPCFNIYLEEVEAWGIEALEACMDGVTARKAVHICYGYGTPAVLAWKTKNTDWGHYGVTLPLLARSSVHQISVELAASGVDLAVLRAAGEKEILLGVIDVGSEEIETPEIVGERIRRALDYVPAARVKPSTDCGLVPRSREAARGKDVPDPSDPKWVRMHTRMASELGADLIKTDYTGDAASMRTVVERCPTPILLAGGPRKGSDASALALVEGAAEAGAAGVIMGRNVFQAPDMMSFLAQARSILSAS
jgi:5-methyltetrahydropteroyltriglutamate--homocysteine methyltransferase